MMEVQVKRLHSGDLPLPRYMTEGSAGLDLFAAVDEPMVIAPGSVRLVPTGLAIAMPPELEAQIRPRSGLALKHGLTLLNSPGTIDADYRGEIKIIIINLGSQDFLLQRGERIAQMIFSRVEKPCLVEVQELDETTRNSGGFGHTGR